MTSTADPRDLELVSVNVEAGFADYRLVGAPGWRFRTAAAAEVPPSGTVRAPSYLHEHGDDLVEPVGVWRDGGLSFRCDCGSELRLVCGYPG